MSDSSSTKAAPAASPLGKVGGFELLIELAAGGMATVYLAHVVDGRTGQPLVAVKRPHRHLATDKVFLSMLIDEARLASAIDHPNVVKVRELGFEGGEPFVVMDYVEGASLSDLRKALSALGRTLDTRVAVRIVLDALAGLRAAHEQKDESGKPLGIIHRDVSPHNVIVGCDGVARLTDFGIAKAEDRVQTTRTHEVKGKLAYLAPERVDKRRMCTVQSDIFSMAVVLWECIAGRRLFRGDEAIDTLQEVMSAPIPKLRQLGANVNAALDDVIARALSRDLDTRHQTAGELSEAIERAVGKANIAPAEEVGKVVEAVFGGKMAVRHDSLRKSASSADVDALIQASGLPRRPPPTSDGSAVHEAEVAQFAPLAPSARYTFGQVSDPIGRTSVKKPRWGLISGIAGGAVLGGIVAAVLLTRPSADGTTGASAATAGPMVQIVSSEPSLRKVVVPLPFLSTQVMFDDVKRTLDPALDVASFDVPRESGTRHRVVAVALDGTRAEGYVVETDGVARVDEHGFLLEVPKVAAAPASVPSVRPRPPPAAPIGTTKNGFTKLK